MGTPSVVVRNTAPAEVILDGNNGLICEDSPECLRQTVEHYLFDMDSTDRARVREQAQKTNPRPWEIVMRKVIERYLALSTRQGRRKKRVFPIRLQ